MTVAELTKRVVALEAEVHALKSAAPKKISIADQLGAFANDPLAADADRLGRAYREKVNRDSLREKKPRAKRKLKPLKKSA